MSKYTPTREQIAQAGERAMQKMREEGLLPVHPMLRKDSAPMSTTTPAAERTADQSALTADEIFAIAKVVCGRNGHDLIWETDPMYAAAVDMPKNGRWSVESVRAEQTLAFARAIQVAAAPSLLSEVAALRKALEEIAGTVVYAPEGGHEEVAECVRIAHTALVATYGAQPVKAPNCKNYGSPGGPCPSHPFCGCFSSERNDG
jgi:hypothetical protein